MILGIAVNYSLHFLTHYRYHPDMKETIKDISFPMIIGSATTIGGFLCLQFLTIPVLKDLGLFAAFSLIGAALSTLIFLPHFVSHKAIENNNTIFDNIYTGLSKLNSNKYIAIAFIVLTPVFYHFANKVAFENDMMKINYMTPQLKHAEEVFNKFSSFYKRSIFVVAKGKTMDEALANNETILPELDAMKAKGEIISYSNVANILVSDKEQQNRIVKWKAY